MSIYSNKNQNYKFGEIIEVDACQDRFFEINEKFIFIMQLMPKVVH
ncbi:hypothetical protein [Metamycoplasma hominis]